MKTTLRPRRRPSRTETVFEAAVSVFLWTFRILLVLLVVVGSVLTLSSGKFSLETWVDLIVNGAVQGGIYALIGHVKGAFTGASAERHGAATQADGGTLFLDEIGEMDIDLQSKLLRFVQTGSFQKVGGSKVEKVDVRFICATNRDPLEMVSKGTFREDLFYRLHVIPIHLPALRERAGDVLLIAEYFLQQFSQEENKKFIKFDSQVTDIIGSYPWPGNVREVQNVMRNIVVLHQGEIVTKEMLPSPINTYSPSSVPSSNSDVEQFASVQQHSESGSVQPLWMVEKQAIESAVKLCNGNIPRAAAKLEVSPSTIYRKRQSWGN